MTTVGILYHPQLAAAEDLARQLASRLRGHGAQVWLAPAYREDGVRDQLDTTDYLVGLGGDGTLLRAAKAVLPRAVPVLGVNFGRLGFLAELQPDEALERIPALLEGAGRLEERSMIEAIMHRPRHDGRGEASAPMGQEGPHPALNDVVVARYAPGRPVYVEATVDGQLLNIYRCDGVIVATATGSTGYNLSAGGPVLHPDSHNMVLTPVAPHLSLANSLVLNPDSVVDLRIHTDHQAVMSVDGQLDFQLQEGDHIVIRRSQHTARFVRNGPPGLFYRHLMDRLR